jgi:hypothetical protein
LDFIPENEEETNLSTKLVILKKRIRLKLYLLLFVLEIAVGNRFATRDAAERISDTLNEKEFILPTIMVEWIKMKESVL